MESTTDRLNVPTNDLDVPTDLVKTKRGGQLYPLILILGYANALLRLPLGLLSILAVERLILKVSASTR